MGENEHTILIVEDEADYREMLACEFESKGFRVRRAPDGQVALDMLAGLDVGTIIADIRMPGMDGLDLLEHVKSNDASSPAFVLISAYANIEIDQALCAGAEALFKKPFRLVDLLDRVHALILSPAQRWGRRPEKCDEPRIVLTTSHLESGSRGDVLGIGRGGMWVEWQDLSLSPGQPVTFEVNAQEGSMKRFSGSGVVRWAHPANLGSTSARYGIEFAYISDEFRDQLIKWIRGQDVRAFIPSP